MFFPRVPEDGYYMFTLVVREPGITDAAGTVLLNGVTTLCRAEQGRRGVADRYLYGEYWAQRGSRPVPAW